MTYIKDNTQFRVVNDKMEASIDKLLKQIPDTLPIVYRNKILYNMMAKIQKKTQIPK